MAAKPQKQSEAEVSSWGFSNVFTWTDTPNAYYSPHKHTSLTTHLVLRGEMIVLLPDEKDAAKKSYGAGERVDIQANQMHEVWIGKEGCTSVIGE